MNREHTKGLIAKQTRAALWAIQDFPVASNGTATLATTETDEQREQTKIALVAKVNYDELVRRMARYGITISAREFPNWRPTKLSRGDISGVAEGVTLIATDGLLGYFVDDNERPFYGHVDWFSGKVEVWETYEREKKKTAKPRAKTQEEKADELLAMLQKGKENVCNKPGA